MGATPVLSSPALERWPPLWPFKKTREPARRLDRTRSLTLESPHAPADNGSSDFDKSPPSIVIPWLAAPSTRKKTGPGLFTRTALGNMSRESMNRVIDSALASAGQVTPFTAASSTWSNTIAGRNSSGRRSAQIAAFSE
ncbi:hypothetical protein SBA4_940005 [Candidatus Sulfopaludibacter sp. SbA4]|nr:hypothetical protein SBA4_940005 [Candidatus Sulfopaludibacter sp. SbA4]